MEFRGSDIFIASQESMRMDQLSDCRDELECIAASSAVIDVAGRSSYAVDGRFLKGGKTLRSELFRVVEPSL